MFQSVLVANRGEIAVRIMRTARRMGLRTIAVYSDADAAAPHVRLADEAHRIGPAPARESYLLVERLLEVAGQSGAECIHPGYGFLSENAAFAEACAAAGIAFVGPSPAAIRAMGLKDAAKALVERAGVPVVPGYHGEKQEPGFLKMRAENIGFPVLIKAVAGGGGKGMRRVDRIRDFEDALVSAQREAESAFGDPRVLVEKYVQAPRHIEVQVFGDSHGKVLHLFERDCSCQRRHQKVIEEAPAPGMTAAVRAAMGKAAVDAAKAVNYVGAGTVEFIVDGAGGLRPDGFYFMEMNTRLQVEHPVTELITGLDLVEWQLRVAAGEALPWTQDDLAINGHAVEARVYAEDPETGFLPSTGRLLALRLPTGEGVRVDSGVEEGGSVTPFYDPMIAKVITHGADRDEALDRLSAALDQTLVAGPRCNVAFLKALANQADFRAGRLDTGLIERHLAELGAVPQPAGSAALAAAVQKLAADRQEAHAAGSSPWAVADGFALAPHPGQLFPVLVDDAPLQPRLLPAAPGANAGVLLADGAHRPRRQTAGVTATGAMLEQAEGGVTLVADGDGVLAIQAGKQVRVAPADPFAIDWEALEAGGDGAGTVRSPMHGRLVALFVVPGEGVEKGQRLAIVEAMKMEHVLLAPRAGAIAEVLAEVGQQVAERARLIVIGEA
jgi:3-methylcrotonyl-CoA carboxylase alpha subunit